MPNPIGMIEVKLRITATVRKMKRIGIDLTTSSRGVITGWERSTINLYSLLLKFPEPDIEIIGFKGQSYSGNYSKLLNYGNDVKNIILPHELDYELDLVHANTIVPRNISCLRTWTVHDDLILGGHREFRKKSAYLWEILGKLKVNRIEKVLTFSETVAEELVSLGVRRSKIATVQPIVNRINSNSLRPSELSEEAEEKGIALVVGSIENRKNPVYATILALEAGLQPLVIGRFKDINRSAFPSEVIILENCNDQNLKWLYTNSKIVISTSHYEGVNMPMVEATLEGTPIAYSNIPIHKELFGSSNMLPVGRVEAVTKITEIVKKKQLIDVSKFTNEKAIAQEYYQLWRELLN